MRTILGVILFGHTFAHLPGFLVFSLFLLAVTHVASRAPWWKGTRGEWHVVVQIVLMALVLFGPRAWPGGALLPFPRPGLWSTAALVVIVAGAALFVTGLLWLGWGNITPLPYPREEGTLVDSGPFGLVRHPMYAGGVLVAFGWAVWVRGPLTIGYAIMLLVLADIKSRREEQWLGAKFPGYAAYQSRVRKLIPFVY